MSERADGGGGGVRVGSGGVVVSMKVVGGSLVVALGTRGKSAIQAFRASVALAGIRTMPRSSKMSLRSRAACGNLAICLHFVYYLVEVTHASVLGTRRQS